MNMRDFNRVALTATIIVTLIASVPSVRGQPRYTLRELSFVVYADGYVAVDYIADIDPTRPRVNVSLPGSLYLDLLVEDQDGLPLDHSPAEDGLTIDTLGATSVLISYVTPDLTGKSGQIWSFNVSTSISSSILLPEGATIVSLNTVPLFMSSLDGILLITMPSGDLKVAYTIGIVGTREHAMAVIKDAEATLQTVKATGIVAEQADELLQQAYDALDAENYPEAEQYAAQAKSAALEAGAEAVLAKEAINTAQDAIMEANSAGRTVGLDDAETLLHQAEDRYEGGNYTGAHVLAEDAQAAAIGAKAPENQYTWLVIILAAAVIIIASLFYMRRRRQEIEGFAEKIDLETLFAEHRGLRVDDREVIRFLAEAGGEAFSAEVRERFKIPRTSLWRMIRRLQREGVVDVENIGGQSLVRIVSKYQRSATSR
jgi:uncharacterized membrane protein